MSTYPGNSHKSKDVKRTEPTDEKKIQKRVSKPAKTKKKGELRKIAEEFIVDDVKNIKTYVITDVLILLNLMHLRRHTVNRRSSG